MLEKAKKKLGLIFILTEIICMIAIGLTTIITLNNLNKNHCIDNIVNLHSCKNLCKYL